MKTITRRMVAPVFGATSTITVTTTKEKKPMKRLIPLLAILAVYVAVMGISSFSALARPYGIDNEAGGVCGGGNNISNLVKGWEEHGAINQAIATTGSHVHLDGTAQQIAQKGFVWVIVTKGTWVHNTTCLGHGFTPISSMKFVPAGTRVPAPAWEAPAPGKTGTVKNSFDPHCGNLHPHSRLPVRRPGKKSKKKPQHSVSPPTPATPATPATSAPSISIVNAPVFNQGQTQGQQQQQAQSVCISLGGTWNEVTQNCSITQQQAQCNSNQVLFGGVCVNKTCEELGNCEPPPPPPPPPCESCECKECKPPPKPPTIVSMTVLNDVPIGLTSPNFEVTANVPSGDSGKIIISPEFGRMNPRDNPTTGRKTFSVPGGTTTETLTYEPPTEVPSGTKEIPAGDDRITVTVIDTVTGLEVEKYTQFRIEPEPVNPG